MIPESKKISFNKILIKKNLNYKKIMKYYHVVFEVKLFP